MVTHPDQGADLLPCTETSLGSQFGWRLHRPNLLVYCRVFVSQHFTKDRVSTQMSEISSKSVVVASKDQVSCGLSGEAAILNLSDGMYYGLNEVGARIWSLLSAPIEVAKIRDQIEREYDVDIERCEKDLITLLGKLNDAGLIEVNNEAPA